MVHVRRILRAPPDAAVPELRIRTAGVSAGMGLARKDRTRVHLQRFPNQRRHSVVQPGLAVRGANPFPRKGIADTGDRTRGASLARVQLRVRSDGAGILGQQMELGPQRGRDGLRLAVRLRDSLARNLRESRLARFLAVRRIQLQLHEVHADFVGRRATCCACSCTVPKSASTGVSDRRVEIIASLKRAAE